jgi:hypothetical protein
VTQSGLPPPGPGGLPAAGREESLLPGHTCQTNHRQSSANFPELNNTGPTALTAMWTHTQLAASSTTPTYPRVRPPGHVANGPTPGHVRGWTHSRSCPKWTHVRSCRRWIYDSVLVKEWWGPRLGRGERVVGSHIAVVARSLCCLVRECSHTLAVAGFGQCAPAGATPRGLPPPGPGAMPRSLS